MKTKKRLKANEVEWIVNDIGELGIRVSGQCFFLYKGHSLEYTGNNEDGTQMMVRNVGKREFGEVCLPLEFNCVGKYDVGDGWKPLPKKKNID